MNDNWIVGGIAALVVLVVGVGFYWMTRPAAYGTCAQPPPASALEQPSSSSAQADGLLHNVAATLGTGTVSEALDQFNDARAQGVDRLQDFGSLNYHNKNNMLNDRLYAGRPPIAPSADPYGTCLQPPMPSSLPPM